MPERQAGGGGVVTPEMIGAGVNELCSYDWERDDPRGVVSRILVSVLGRDVVTGHEMKNEKLHVCLKYTPNGL